MLRDFARGRKYEMLKGYVAAVCPRSDCVVVFRICRNLVQLMAKSDGQSCFPKLELGPRWRGALSAHSTQAKDNGKIDRGCTNR